jgi:hypothetical protein
MAKFEPHACYNSGMTSLDEVLQRTAAALPYTAAHYPALGCASLEEQTVFALRHSALHLSKTAGELAALSEASDHGCPVDQAAFRRIALKAVVNAMRLSVSAGVQPRDIVEHVAALTELEAAL